MPKKQPKRILIVPHYYPPHQGGIERVAQNQARQLAARGHTVTVVTSSVAADQKNGVFEGVRVRRVKAWNFLERFGIPFPLFSPRLLPILWREVGKADIVHIHDVFYLSSLTAALFAVWRKRPIVLTQHVAAVPHSPAINLVEKAVYATTGAFIFRHSFRIMVLNDRVEAFVRSYGVEPDRLCFLPIGTDCQLFHPASAAEKRTARQRFGFPQTKQIVLFVGRAVPKKGFDKVLAAQSADYLLVFAGGKYDRQDTDKAKFLGFVAPATMAEIFRTADVYVLPSEGEGFPMTAQEAMASGLPVVLRDDPGYKRYQLTPQFVHLLKDAQPATIKKALAALLADPARRQKMGTQARQYIQDRFAWDKLIAELDKIYGEAIVSHERTT